MEDKKLTLPEFEDGEELKPELEKDADKSLKDAKKEFDKLEKEANEINDADAGKPNLKDGSGNKSFKIKGLKEHLTLDENEIEEALPKDVANAYKYSKWIPYTRGRSKSSPDFQKAEYTPISVDDAVKEIKSGNAKDLRLLIDGELITLKDSGYGDTTYRSQYVDRDKAYVKRSGEVVRDTAHMPIRHLLSIADKVYLTNENSTGRDQEKIKARSQNLESPNYSGETLRSRPIFQQGYGNEIRGDSYNLLSPRDAEKYRKRIKEREDSLRGLKNRLDNGEISQSEYDRLADSVKYDIDLYNGYLNRNRDTKARIRYADSEKSLQSNLEKMIDLRDSISRSLSTLNSAKIKLKSIKDNGSPEVKRLRDNYNSLQDELRSINKRLAMCELELEGSDEADSAAIKAAEEAIKNAEDSYNGVRLEMDKLLHRKSESLEEDINNEQQDFSTSSLLSSLIRLEWEAADQYNSIIATIENNDNNTGVIEELKDLVSDKYANIGMLENMLQEVNPVAETALD